MIAKSSKNKIRLLVIEDNRILREGIIAILRQHRDIKIIAGSEKNENTILNIHKLKPNIILLDLGLRSQSSLALVQKVKNEFSESKVIVMDLVPVQADVMQFVQAGASGFILKNATLDEFLMTIRAVAEGVKILPPQLKDSLFMRIVEYAIKSGKTKLIDAVKMTKQEKEILSLISDGNTNKIISRKMKVTEYNVKSHIHNILEKLALRTRIEQSKYVPGNGTANKFSESISIIHK
jgi:DNA-binding NarL/FixJ family response regulator